MLQLISSLGYGDDIRASRVGVRRYIRTAFNSFVHGVDWLFNVNREKTKSPSHSTKTKLLRTLSVFQLVYIRSSNNTTE